MENKSKIFLFLLIAFMAISLTSAVVVDSDYITVYPGDEGKISIEVENNENFDIESVSLTLELNNLPFTSIGSSEHDYEDIKEDDSESETFTIKPSTGITPGDYDLPYKLRYVNADNTSQDFEVNGSFGIRVSAKTDLDFSAETNEVAIIGQTGRINIEVINQGLGEIKSLSVEIVPNGFELLSKSKNFIGTVNSDDSDSATFDVLYKIQNPTFSAKITYKDFENNDQEETRTFSIKVYTKEKALELGLIEKPSYTLYIVIIILLIIWFGWRRIKKRKKMRKE